MKTLGMRVINERGTKDKVIAKAVAIEVVLVVKNQIKRAIVIARIRGKVTVRKRVLRTKNSRINRMRMINYFEEILK